MWASRIQKRVRVCAVALVPAVCAFGGVAVAPLGAEVASAETPIAAGNVVAMYGGLTSNGWPVFAEVARNGRVIKRIVGTMAADCTQGGSDVFPSTWRNVRVSRNGTFTATYEDTDPLDNGGEIVMSERLTGKLNRARTRISATWRASTTFRSPHGTVDTCDTGALRVALHR